MTIAEQIKMSKQMLANLMDQAAVATGENKEAIENMIEMTTQNVRQLARLA